jgi:hypothetical protein
VIDWPKDGMSHGRVLRQRTNGWTCMPDVPGRPQHDPMCVNETMMTWLMATLAGKKPDIDRVGLAYMLLGEARQGQNASTAKDPSQVKEWFCVGPYFLVVLPDSAKDALRGINQDLSNNQPYTTLLSSAHAATPLWVISVAKSGGRIKGGASEIGPDYTVEVECAEAVMSKVSVMYPNPPGARFDHAD